MNSIESIEVGGGLTITTYYDDCPQCPREWDTLGTIYSNHRDYDFDGHKIDEIIGDNGELSIAETHYYLNVYAYIHSGIALSTTHEYPFNDRWDSGLFGIIAVSKDEAAKEFPEDTETKALASLEAEIELLDKYCRGECYGYAITDKYGDEVGSCWGFIGDYEDMLNDAELEAEYIAKDIDKQEFVTGKSAIMLEVEWSVEKSKAAEIGEQGITDALESILLVSNPESLRVNGVTVTKSVVL